MYYLMGYAFTNMAVFIAVIAITNRTGNELISGFNGMGRRSPILAVLLTVGLLSLLGVPPTVGFMSKAFVFSAAANSGLLWLAILGMINTVVSAYYYLRVVRAIYFEEPASDTPVRPRRARARGGCGGGCRRRGIRHRPLVAAQVRRIVPYHSLSGVIREYCPCGPSPGPQPILYTVEFGTNPIVIRKWPTDT